MAKTELVKMETMVSGGDCLGRLSDGRAVFVPFVLPDEVVNIELIEDKKRFARGRALELFEESLDRIEPRCAHFGLCGGCQYQHLSYTKQLALKETLIADQLQRIGKIEAPPIKPIIPSPSAWGYRNHIQFHLGQDGEMGYIHVNGEHLLVIDECHLPQPAIDQIWPQLDLGAGSGVYRMGIRQDSFDDVMLILEGDDPTPPAFSEDIPVSAVYTPPEARLTVLAGDDHLIYQILDRQFQVSARSFFQVNTPMAERMVQYLLDNLPLESHQTLLELYAGIGLFSAFLAPRVASLVAVESNGSACHDFALNLDDLENVTLYEAEAEAALPALDIQPEVLVMDPPRAGLANQVVDAIAKLLPKHIAYISCDPATLARDLRKLIDRGYRLDSITPFDLFPQTAHIESISLLSYDRE